MWEQSRWVLQPVHLRPLHLLPPSTVVSSKCLLSGHLPNTEFYLNFFSSAQLPKPWSGCPALPEPSSARFFGLFIQIKPFCVVHIKQKLQASLIIKNNPPALRRCASASSPQSLSRDLRLMHAELIIFSFMWSFPAYATSLLEFSQHSDTFILIN